MAPGNPLIELSDFSGPPLRMVATRSASVIDALLAATALAHGLVLVTRNTADVEGLGAQLFNPFNAAAG
ncbi:MAG TPA: hypothetical protein VMD08_00765 [Candidatus Baltobacteraceae bacterium]|nr:hypothetical protein [Candidatus Baltobacteraceae bacterium]